MATEKPPARGAAQSRPRSKGSDSAAKRKTAPRTQARESKASSDTADDLSAEERRKVEKSQPPRALVLHEVIRLQGNHELERTLAALWWSALAAGLLGAPQAAVAPARFPLASLSLPSRA